MSESSDETAAADHTIKNDANHDKCVQEAIEDMDRILNSSLNGSESNKDFAIGKLTNGF